jgi:putative ABC transport system permease protein
VLAREHIDISYVATAESDARNENAHTYVLMLVLGLVVLGISIVGAVGLATALSASVIERTREFGIMRATGARSSQVVWIVLCEALFVGALSATVAIALSALLTLLIVQQMRSQTSLPLSLVFSSVAAVAWLVMSLVIAALASIYPAKRAVGLTVRRALSLT